MTAFQDEIGGIFEDVKRYSMGDSRIEFCLDEAMKRITAEVDALAFEGRALDAALVRATTEREAARITEPDLTWRVREPDWRGNDYYEGPAE